MPVSLYSRRYISKLLSLLMFFLLSFNAVPTVLAVSTYNVVETSATVGTSTDITLEYILDTTQQTWQDNDTLIVNLPSNIGSTGWATLTYTVELDEADSINNGNEISISNGGGPGQYSIAGPDLTVLWNESSWAADTGDVIRVLITGVSPQYTNSSTTFTWSGSTSSGSDTNPFGSDTINVMPADAAASLVLGDNATVGVSGTTIFNFSVPVNLVIGDTVSFTAPNNLDVSAVAYSLDGFTGDFGSCSPVGQVVTCTVTSPVTAANSGIGLTGVVSKYAATAQTISSVFVFDTSASATISVDSSGVSEDTVAADAAATFDLSTNAVVGGVGSSVLALTIPYALESGDTISFTAPDSLDVSDVMFFGTDFTGAFSGCDPVGQVVTCTTASSVPADTGSITMTGVVSKYAALTPTISGVVVYDTTASANIALDSSGSFADAIVSGDAAASLSLDTNAIVGGSGASTFTVTLPYAIDSGDTIGFVASDNLDVSDVSFGASTFSGTFSGCEASAQEVICTADSSSTATTGNIVLNGIAARFGANSQTITGAYVYDLSATSYIAQDVSGSVSDTTLADAAASIVLDGNEIVGEEGTTTVTFTLPTDLASGDSVVIDSFASFIDPSGVTYASDTFDGAGAFTCSEASDQVVTCLATGDITAGTGSLTLSGIVSTAVGTDDVSMFYVLYENDSDQIIAGDSEVILTDTEEASSGSSGSSGGGSAHHSSGGSSSTSGTTDAENEEEVFSDLSPYSSNYSSIMELYEAGVINGYSDGTIRENLAINRAELMKILVLGVYGEEPSVEVYSNCFSDVGTEWFAPYICFAKEQGWVSGYSDGSFKPGEGANIAEMLKMILNVNEVVLEESEEGAVWYEVYLDTAESIGLSLSILSPGLPATRGSTFNTLVEVMSL